MPSAETIKITDAYNRKTFFEFPYVPRQISGLALPNIDHRTIRAPFQHGETYLGFSLRPRVIQIQLHVRGTSGRLSLWERRQDLISAINPLAGPFNFHLVLGSGERYFLRNVQYQGPMQAQIRYRGSVSAQNIGLRFIADDPVWYEGEEQSISAFLEADEMLVFGDINPDRAVFPIVFDVDSISMEQLVTVEGTWYTYPTIRLTGPMINPRITNESTGEKVELGYEIDVGEVVTILTEFGNKTVHNNAGENLMGHVTNDSDLSTFHMAPNPYVPDGTNVLAFYAEDTIVTSFFEVLWYSRYAGV